MDTTESLFSSAPVPRAVAKMAIPTVLSMLVTVVYNMADTFFVGQTGDANQVAAVSLAMPIFLIIMALGNMFGVGGSAAIARLLGAGERARTKHVSSFCFYGSLAVGTALIAVLLGTMPVLLRLLGASDNTAGFAREYLVWISVGAPFILTANAFSSIVRGEGASKASMLGMMLGTVVNIVLDPLMILTLGWGVAGAAIATVLGNLATIAYYLVYFARGKTLLSIAPKDFRARGVAGQVVAIGAPASVNNLLMSVANIILNNFLALYGDVPVAAMGVAMKANMLVVFVQLGLAMGVQPLIGYSYGARNFVRMKSVVRFSTLCTLVMGVALTAAYFLGTEGILRLFIADEAVVGYGVPMLRALMLSGPLLGMLFVLTNALQAMGRAAASLVLSLCRQGLLFLPALLLFHRLFGLDGVIYAQPISDLLSIAVAGVLFAVTCRRLPKEEAASASAPVSVPADAEIPAETVNTEA